MFGIEQEDVKLSESTSQGLSSSSSPKFSTTAGWMEGSKTGKEEVISYIHSLPNESWPESDPSVVDQVTNLIRVCEKKLNFDCFRLISRVWNKNMLFEILIQMELSLAHGCPELVDRETLVEYIHHNRDLNTRRIGTIGKMVLSDELLCNISDQGRRLRGCEEHD